MKSDNVLQFPQDDFVPPAFSWRTWAAGQVATWRERRQKANAALSSPVQSDRMHDKGDVENVQEGPESAPRRSECWTEPDTSVTVVSTDVQGSPSESYCSQSQLDNILATRDEIEARKAARTVRPIDQPDCPNCKLPEDECFCVDENDLHGDE